MSDKRVYFLRPVGQLGPIKIGCSVLPEIRLDSFTIWSPVRLEVVCSVPGGHKQERTLHGMFAKHHVHGEWFGAAKELLALIDHCAAEGALPDLPEVVKFPRVRHVGYKGRAAGKFEQRPLKGIKAEIAARIRAEYESGVSGVTLADKHGLNYQTVLRYVRLSGGTVRRAGSPRTKSGVENAERAEEMARLYAGGLTLQEIGDKFSLTRERVRQLLRKTNVPSLGYRIEHCRKPDPLSDAQIEAVRMYANGVRPSEIAERTGLSISEINSARMKVGVDSPGVGYWNTRPDDAEITQKTCDLYRAGLSAPAIVAQVPELRHPETVYRYLKKGGVPVRHKRAPRGSRKAA